jgi:hypothetical protein
MGRDGNAVRRSLVNSIQVDVIDDSGGVMGILVRLVGVEQSKKCANLLAQSIVQISDNALLKRLADEGFIAPNMIKGKINNYEKPVITSEVRMGDSYVRPQGFQVLLASMLMGLVAAFFVVVLRKRYRGE